MKVEEEEGRRDGAREFAVSAVAERRWERERELRVVSGPGDDVSGGGDGLGSGSGSG